MAPEVGFEPTTNLVNPDSVGTLPLSYVSG